MFESTELVVIDKSTFCKETSEASIFDPNYILKTNKAYLKMN